MKNIFVFILLFSAVKAFSQGTIEGYVFDTDSVVLPFSTVVLYQNDSIVFGTITDFDGYFLFDSLKEVKYDLVVNYMGFNNSALNINLQNSKRKEIVLYLKIGTIIYCPIGPYGYTTYPYLINNPYSEEVLTSNDIEELKIKNIEKLISTKSGFTKDKDGNLSLKGSRPETLKYYIDGVPIIGKPNIPTSAIEHIEIYSNGTPAKF